MDISRALSIVLRRLFRAHVQDLVVNVHVPDRNSLQHWIVAIHFRYQDQWLQAGAIDRQKSKAITKSIIECGESILAFDKGLLARCGIAGGIFLNTTKERAKLEVLERDAFLFHYRGNIPFVPLSGEILDRANKENSAGLRAFRMLTRDPGKFAAFVTDDFGASGADRCLQFGASCSESIQVALSKAISEYSGINFNHRFEDGRCKEQFLALAEVLPITQRHHYSSLDIRNRQRIAYLCSNSNFKTKNRGALDSKGWKTTNLPSPVKGILYVHASHPELEELEFGKPETWSDLAFPLYHPYY